MTTRLDRALRREVWIDDKPYTLTLTVAGCTIVRKRHRKGIELLWKDLVATHGQNGQPAESYAGRAGEY